MKLNYLFDVLNNRYLGIDIPKFLVEPYIKVMSDDLDNEEEFQKFIKFKDQRDGEGKYHITVLNVMEFNKIFSNNTDTNDYLENFENIFGMDFDVKILGLGKATKNENTAYFLVVRSEGLNNFRKHYGLEPKDLHITIAFKYKDVFGVPKNKLLNNKPPFQKLLKEDYFKSNETFNFLRNQESFNYDLNTPIDVITIKDSYAIFRVGNYNYFQVSEISGKLEISGKWESKEKRNIYAQTLIHQFMTNK